MADARRGLAYAAAFALCAALVGSRWLAPFDLQTTLLLQHWGRSWLDWLLFAFTLIGSIESTTLIAAWLGWRHWRAGRRRTAVVLWSVFATMTLVEVFLKFHLPQSHVPAAFNRSPRRGFLLVHVPTPYVFPSGHTLRSVFLFGYVGEAVVGGRPRAAWRRVAQALLVVTMVMIGVGRIYLGDHWASDVVGGSLLAATGLWWLQRIHTSTVPS